MPAYEGGVSVTKAPLTAGSVKHPDWPHLACHKRHHVDMPLSWRRRRAPSTTVSSRIPDSAAATVFIARNAFSYDMSWKIAVLPSTRSQRELLTNDGASEEIQEKRRYCHDNCTCTLLVFLVCIEPLYYTVLNVTSYETLYDSIALQTNKQNQTAMHTPKTT